MKKLISVLLIALMLLPTLASLSIGAETIDGFTFNDEVWYYADSKLPSAPTTVEAWVYVDPDHATERQTILSNYNGFTGYGYIHFDLKYENGVLFPYFEWNELYNNTNSIRKFNFREAVITAGEWVHIAVVIDAPNNYVSCYKNGKYIQSNGGSFTLCDIADNVTEFTLGIGNDCRPAAEGTADYRAFNGKIASISLFTDIRNASEIASDYSNGVDTTDKNALAHWEFSPEGGAVKDKVGNVNLSQSKFWLSESEMQSIRGNDFDPAYSFAVVGDIQYITEYDMNNSTDYVKQMHKWLGDNAAAGKKNIKFVMGVGDITNGDRDAEWKIAYNGISSTLNGKVGYSLVRGNHDLYGGGSGFDRYFGNDSTYTAQYSGSTGGTYKSGSYVNSYTTFTVGSTKWLIINLDFAVSDDVLEWANEVVSSHPDHKAIMTTHGYAHMDGTPLSDEDSSSLWGDEKNNGEEMWTKFASLHKNMVMVISGHMECNFITVNQAKGVHGNTVTQFLIDQQTLDKAYMAKEGMPLGLVAMFYFDKDGRNVSIEWYSTLRDKYFQTRNQVSFDMEAKAPEQTFGWCGVSYTPKGSGTQSDPYIIENGGNLLWISENCKDSSALAPAFEGKYFKQVCDIDLNGNIIKSIGYFHTTDKGIEKMAAFGGHYDGGGYSIKNGRISAQNIGHAHDITWSDGLFGAIYGATIKNVNLEDLDIYGKGVTGALVGRAIAPFDGSATADFNLISGCSVSSSCNVYAYLCKDNPVNDATTYGSKLHAGIIGGICGMAYGTTIVGCTSDINVTADGDHSVVGGIAGTAGYNSIISKCAFTGSITLTDTSARTAASIGGIVGAAIPNEKSTTAWMSDNTVGALDILNCYNEGSFAFTGATAKELHWGGIIGNASNLYDMANCVKISHCYNLYERKSESVLSTSDYWAGGIVGKATSTNGAAEGSVTVENSMSVAIDACGGIGSNECRYNDVKTAEGLYPLVTVDGTVKTAAADTVKTECERIDKLIEKIKTPVQNEGGNDNDGGNNNGSNNEGPKPTQKPSNTTAKPTKKPSSTTEKSEDDGGCGSVIGISSALVCILAIAPAFIKKKD